MLASRVAARVKLLFADLRRAQPYPSPASVFGDELDASVFQSLLDHRQGLGIAGISAGLEVGNGVSVEPGGVGQVSN